MQNKKHRKNLISITRKEKSMAKPKKIHLNVCVSCLSLDWLDICLILKDYCQCAVTESFCSFCSNLSVLHSFLFASILYYII